MRVGRSASACLRSLLALLLVCAQVFAAAHAVGHVGELSALARLGVGASAAQADYEGGVPDAESHASCLQCLAAADLSAALPSMPALPALESLPPQPGGEPALAPLARRLPCPHSRGPPPPSV
jgi:hypothetical protein